MSYDELVKKFNIPQTRMLRESRTVLNVFKIDQPKFSLFSKGFKTPYEIDWEAAIKAGEEEPDDDAVVADQKLETEDVEAEMEACRKCFQGAKYFIELAFPNKQTIWQKFGYGRYIPARKNHDKMFRFMTNFHAAAEFYHTELIAVEYTQLMIDNILVLRDELNDKLTDQQTKIDSRPHATFERITILNHAWDYRVKVAKAAKEIFKDDPPRYRFYLLPEPDSSDKNINFKAIVTEAGTGRPLANAMINLGNDLPMIYTNSKGEGEGEDIPVFSYTSHVSLDGYLERDISMNVEEGQKFVIHIELVKYTG